MQVKNFKPMPLDIQGWNGNAPIFKELIEEVNPKIIIEVGTWKGQSTANMAKESSPETKIYCVDTWLGSYEFIANERRGDVTCDTMKLHGYPQVYYQFLSNMIHEGVVDKVEPIPATSENAYPHVPEAELIYIDADHTYKSVMEDVTLYWNKLKKGGIMFGDDYFFIADRREEDGFKPDVKTAVDEFAINNNLVVETRYNNFWIIRK